MIMYKGFRAVYLGLKRWRIFTPSGWTFDVSVGNVICLVERIELWRGKEWV